MKIRARFEENYPTRWAYDRASAALWKHRDRADKAERSLAAADGTIREMSRTIVALVDLAKDTPHYGAACEMAGVEPDA